MQEKECGQRRLKCGQWLMRKGIVASKLRMYRIMEYSARRRHHLARPPNPRPLPGLGDGARLGARLGNGLPIGLGVGLGIGEPYGALRYLSVAVIPPPAPTALTSVTFTLGPCGVRSSKLTPGPPFFSTTNPSSSKLCVRPPNSPRIGSLGLVAQLGGRDLTLTAPVAETARARTRGSRPAGWL